MKEFDDNKIDDYLLGRMEEIDLKEFKNRLSMDKEFATRVRQRQETIRYVEVLGDLALKERVQLLHQSAVKNLPSEKTFNIPAILKYAAALAFIIIAGYWLLQGSNSSEDIFKSNYQAYELNFGDRGSDSKNAMVTAGQFYDNGSYQKALDVFNTIPLDSTTAKITLAKGISYLEVSNYEEAAVTFQKLIDNKDPIYEGHARWYLAMTFLKEGKNAEAKNLFQKIANATGSYNQQKATSILQEMN